MSKKVFVALAILFGLAYFRILSSFLLLIPFSMMVEGLGSYISSLISALNAADVIFYLLTFASYPLFFVMYFSHKKVKKKAYIYGRHWTRSYLKKAGLIIFPSFVAVIAIFLIVWFAGENGSDFSLKNGLLAIFFLFVIAYFCYFHSIRKYGFKEHYASPSLGDRYDRIKDVLMTDYKKTRFAIETRIPESLAATSSSYTAEANREIAGNYGEYLASLVFESLPGEKRFLRNFLLWEPSGSFQEIDLLCFWRDYIFVIEAKAWYDQFVFDLNSKMIPKSNGDAAFSPILQSHQHLIALQDQTRRYEPNARVKLVNAVCVGESPYVVINDPNRYNESVNGVKFLLGSVPQLREAVLHMAGTAESDNENIPISDDCITLYNMLLSHNRQPQSYQERQYLIAQREAGNLSSWRKYGFEAASYYWVGPKTGTREYVRYDGVYLEKLYKPDPYNKLTWYWAYIGGRDQWEDIVGRWIR